MAVTRPFSGWFIQGVLMASDRKFFGNTCHPTRGSNKVNSAGSPTFSSGVLRLNTARGLDSVLAIAAQDATALQWD